MSLSPASCFRPCKRRDLPRAGFRPHGVVGVVGVVGLSAVRAGLEILCEQPGNQTARDEDRGCNE